MSGVNKFSGEVQARNNYVIRYYWSISEEKVAPSEKVTPGEKVTPSEEVEKVTDLLDDMDNNKFIEKLYLPLNND